MGLLDIFTKRRARPTNGKEANPGSITEQTLKNLELAERIYANNPPWLYEDKEPLAGTGLGGLIAAEVARLITIESKISVDNNEMLDDICQRYIMPNLRAEVEKGWALGGLILKPYYQNATLKLDTDNKVTAITGKLKVAFVYPAQYLITGYDYSGTVTEIQFFTTMEQDGKYYTLVEQQSYNETNTTLTITNEVYKTDSAPTRYKWDNLGNSTVPLDTVESWKNILPKIVFPNVTGALIGFYKPALANNTDVNSPYGSSSLVRAANAIRRADLTYNGLDWEMDASLARLYIDEVALSTVKDLPQKLTKQIVKLLGSENKRYFEKFNPDIRENSYLNTYNAHLRQVEDIVGLAHGTISKAAEAAKTATEIAMMKQRTYATIVDNQKALEFAIRQFFQAVHVWLYPNQVDANIDMTFDFDDSVVSNPAEQVQTMLQLQAAGNIPAYRTNMSYFNISKEDAQIMVAEANQEAFDDMDDEAEGGFE